MTHDIRDALIDALRPVCANPEVAADACLGVMEKWAADEPVPALGGRIECDTIANRLTFYEDGMRVGIRQL